MANLLELNDISKSFRGVHALEGVDLVVGENEIVGLLGDNGAGKSTLIKIVTGFHTPDTGTISWKGRRLAHLDVQPSTRNGRSPTSSRCGGTSSWGASERVVSGSSTSRPCAARRRC
jgi:ABC-type uncharacterized transport system ATPase subunit